MICMVKGLMQASDLILIGGISLTDLICILTGQNRCVNTRLQWGHLPGGHLPCGEGGAPSVKSVAK